MRILTLFAANFCDEGGGGSGDVGGVILIGCECWCWSGGGVGSGGGEGQGGEEEEKGKEGCGGVHGFASMGLNLLGGLNGMLDVVGRVGCRFLETGFEAGRLEGGFIRCAIGTRNRRGERVIDFSQ